MANLLDQWDPKLVLIEAWQRFWSRSPKFFRVWQIINLCIAGLGLLPNLLTWFEITLTPYWMRIAGKIALFVGGWAYVQNKLPVSEPSVEVMPFTAKKELEKIVDKHQKNQT